MTRREAGGGFWPLLREWGWLGGTAILSLVAVLYGAGAPPLLDPAEPVFGDLAGHLVAIRELQENLGRGRIHGWSYSWYGGFPLFYFYFPLPALLVIGVAAVIGFGPAMTAVVVAGPLLIPIAAAVLVRETGGARSTAFLAGIGSAAFLLSRSLGISGGSLESALVGEFSYAIGMALSLFFLASIPRFLERRTGKALVVPALLLAATALSHVLPTAVAVLGSLALVRNRRDLLPLAGAWTTAFLLSGWWSIPFLGYAGQMSSLSWGPPTTSAMNAWLVEGVPLAFLAVLALTWRSEAMNRQTYRLAALLLGLGVAPLVVPEPGIYPGRLLPYAFWAAHVLGAVVTWQAVRALRRRECLLSSTVVLVGFGTSLGIGLLRGSPRESAEIVLKGTETAVDTDSWDRLVAEIDARPPGAVINAANFSGATGRHPMYLLNLHGHLRLDELTGHRSVYGLWQESSPTSPLTALTLRHLRGDMRSRLILMEGLDPDLDLGIRQARLLGARYAVIAGLPEFLEDLSPREAEELARDSLWRLYEIEGAAVGVEPGRVLPVIASDFDAATQEWYDRGGTSPLPVVLNESRSGIPSNHPRRVASEADVDLSPGEIRMDGVTPGRPLLLRLSYFPNWRLASPGEGPFRAAPHHMLVVPRSGSVRLAWSAGWIETAGLAATSIAIALIVALTLGHRVPLRPARD